MRQPYTLRALTHTRARPSLSLPSVPYSTDVLPQSFRKQSCTHTRRYASTLRITPLHTPLHPATPRYTPFAMIKGTLKRGVSSLKRGDSTMTQRRKALHRADSADDFSYLRAISSLEVTKGMGGIFAARKTFEGDAEEDVDDFSKSHRVTSLDDFVSHSWRNAWWKKGLALNIVLNHAFAKNLGHAVALTSLVVCRAAKELGEGGSFLEQHAISIVTWLPSVVFLVVLYVEESIC